MIVFRSCHVINGAGSLKKSDKSVSNEDILRCLQRLEQKFDHRICKFDERLMAFDKRLQALGTLESKLEAVDRELKSLKTYVYDNINSSSESVSMLDEKFKSLEFDLSMANTKIQSLADDKSKLESMEESLLHVQSQSMRSNLVFTSISEAVGESHEETERKLRSFLVDKCRLAQGIVDEIKFERVHRMGPHRNNSPRDIVAKFTLFKERELVRKSRTNLKGTVHYINEQFPREIAERRKRLGHKLREAISEGKRAWISYDTLYIDGRAVRDTTADTAANSSN